MNFKYLGTAAAEGWPSIFCTCESCKKAMRGGRNIRTRSQAVIDGRLLIDFPADTYLHVLHNGLDLAKISSCLITHNHSDHLYAADLGMRREGFADLPSDRPFTVYATEPAGREVQQMIDLFHLGEQNRVLYRRVTPFVPFLVDRYVVTPLKADHDPQCDPVFYMISDGAKKILYAHDTGYFPDETWDCLKGSGVYLDFVSLDCTFGVREFRHGHMGLAANREVKERLLKMGVANDKTIFCINHFSHNSGKIYDELIPIAKESGFFVSYDGMEIDI